MPDELKLRRLTPDFPPDLTCQNVAKRKICPANVGDIGNSAVHDESRGLMLITPSVGPT